MDVAKTFQTSSKGAIAVEYALLAFPFFLILTAILETSLIFYANVNLQHATMKAARIVRTGEITLRKYSETEFKNVLCSGMDTIINCNRLKIDLRKYDNYADLPTSSPIVDGRLNTADFRYDEIKPGDLVALRTFYEWPVYTDIIQKYLSNLADGNSLISAVSIIKVEPFSKS